MNTIGFLIGDMISLDHATPIAACRIMNWWGPVNQCLKSEPNEKALTENDPKTLDKKYILGLSFGYKITKAIPMMENGAEDSTSIAATTNAF